MKISELKKGYMSSAKRNLEEARKALKLVRERAPIAAKMHAAYEKLLKGSDHYLDSVAGASGTFYITANLRGVLSFKDDKSLLGSLELAMELLGGNATMESKDYADSGYRHFAFRVEGFHIDVYANLKGDGGESCRREVCGVEMVEVKKYRFVCDGVAVEG